MRKINLSKKIGEFITQPKIRYSRLMHILRNIFLLSESELVLVNSVNFICSNKIIGDYYEFGVGGELTYFGDFFSKNIREEVQPFKANEIFRF